MKPIEIAKQREAIRLLQDEVLSVKAFQFKTGLLLRHLAPQYWRSDEPFFFLCRQLPSIRCTSTCFPFGASCSRGSSSPRTLRSIQERQFQADHGPGCCRCRKCPGTDGRHLVGAARNRGGRQEEAEARRCRSFAATCNASTFRNWLGWVIGPRRSMWSDLSMPDFLLLRRPLAAPPDAPAWRNRPCGKSTPASNGYLTFKDAKVQVERGLAQLPLEEIHEQIEKVLKAQLEANDYSPHYSRRLMWRYVDR